MSFLLFTSAPFELLNNTRLSTLRINYLMSVDELERRALKEDVHGERVFEDIGNLDGWRVRGNSKDLVRRGDLLAFFTILAKVRQAEWDKDYATHVAEMANLYRCLPGLGRYPWLRPDFGLLCELVLQVHSRVEVTERVLGVDWQILNEQFDDVDFQPDPSKRSIDPDTGRPIGTATVIRIASSPSIGNCPAWPVYSEALNQDEESPTNAPRKIDYEEICRSHTDHLLFMSFMLTAHLWNIPRKDWEACIGVPGSILYRWIELGFDHLTSIARRRIIAINDIRERLSRHSDYKEDWVAFVSRHHGQLGGQSIAAMLRNGRVSELEKYSKAITEDHPEPARTSVRLVPLVSYESL